MYKVVKESLKLYEETEIPLYRGLSMGLICGLVGLMIHGLGANTFTIVRVMGPFWLIAGLVVSAYKLEMAERAEVASTAKAAIEAGGQGLETKSTEKA